MKYNDKFEGLSQKIGNLKFSEDKKGEYSIDGNKNIEEIKTKFNYLLDLDTLDGDYRRIHELKNVLDFYNHGYIGSEFNDGTKKIALYPGINVLEKGNLIELIERTGCLGKKDEYGIGENFISKDFLENILQISEINFEYALEVMNIKKHLNKKSTATLRREYFKKYPYIEAEYEYYPQHWGGNDYDTVTYGEKSIGIEKISMLPHTYGSVLNRDGDINNLTMNYHQMTGVYSMPSEYEIEEIKKMLDGYGFKFKGLKQLDWFDKQDNN